MATDPPAATRVGAPSSVAPQAERPAPPVVRRAPATLPPIRAVDPPVHVAVVEVGIDAEVVPVGVAADGQMELPADPDVVGWYRHGSAPGGDSGSVVLAGHVDSRRYGVGQLARLREIEVGDGVDVRTAGGVDARYRVVDVESVPKARLPVADLFRRDGEERLVLVTCGGEFDRSRGTYEENIVVTAVRA